MSPSGNSDRKSPTKEEDVKKVEVQRFVINKNYNIKEDKEKKEKDKKK